MTKRTSRVFTSLLLMQTAIGCRLEGRQVTWLRQHALNARSIDPSDEDFADLEPRGEAIGDAAFGRSQTSQ